MKTNKILSSFVVLLAGLSISYGLEIELLTPEDNAIYDTNMPTVREFLANFDARGEKPPRPPKTKHELEQERKQNAAYEAWVVSSEFVILIVKFRFNYG